MQQMIKRPMRSHRYAYSIISFDLSRISDKHFQFMNIQIRYQIASFLPLLISDYVQIRRKLIFIIDIPCNC